MCHPQKREALEQVPPAARRCAPCSPACRAEGCALRPAASDCVHGPPAGAAARTGRGDISARRRRRRASGGRVAALAAHA
eukprot:scaffold4753_cov266-Prasinococcus_capsulatus_cf.AAC.4